MEFNNPGNFGPIENVTIYEDEEKIGNWYLYPEDCSDEELGPVTGRNEVLSYARKHFPKASLQFFPAKTYLASNQK